MLEHVKLEFNSPSASNLLNKFKFVFLVISVFILSFQSFAQWSKQSPVPTHLDVRGVGAPTADRLFIATDDDFFDDGGALFESNDGGLTWVQRNLPVSLGEAFNGLYFLDSQYGWAFGNDNYRTTDGGTTWTQLPSLGSTYFMKFYNQSLGLTTGNFGRYISIDGGNSWSPSPHDIFAFDFIDVLNGLGVSETGVYSTTDGGNSFASMHSGNAKSVVYLSSTDAAAISDGIFIFSTDGGSSWNNSDSVNNKFKLTAVSSDVVIAWGRTGGFPNYDDSVLRSSDGGETWTNLGEIFSDGIFAISVVNSQKIIVADLSGNMYHSADEGLNWNETFTSPGQKPGFLSSASPHFATAQVGYFGYGNGYVIKSTDGGLSWFQISSGTGKSLYDVDHFPNGTLIAVGDNGTLISSDGISPWIQHNKLSDLDMKAVHILDSLNVVVVDDDGQVFKSNNGGVSWTAASSKPANLNSAEDIYFNNLSDGWVIGQSFNTGALYRTTNGGDTWIPVTDFLGVYVAVDVKGPYIWAQNVGGRYYRSTDNGDTWIQEELPGSPHNIRDIKFHNQSIGYVVGFWGEAFRSHDGGITWEVLPTPNSNHNFTGIHLTSANEIWLSTNNDVVYHSATGGQSWSVLDIGSDGFETFNSITAKTNGEAWTTGSQGHIYYFEGPPPPPVNQPPVSDFEFAATGLTVQFTDQSYDPDGSVVGWLWNFGDGTTSTQQHPSHTYVTANTYIVNLTVTDNEGTTGISGRIIVVQPGPGGTFGDFTEVTPLDSLFVTPQDEDFWVVTTAPADYDNDGDIDIAVLGYYVVYNQSFENKLILIRNDGPVGPEEWEFSYIDIPFEDISTGSSDLAWGDLDNDGDFDLKVGSNGKTVIYRNDAGVLNLTDTELPGYWEDNDQADFDLRSISLADYDNDGDLDILIPSVFDNASFSYKTSLMRNDGPNGTGGWIFTEFDSIFAPTSHAQSIWADFDDDQDLDLLLINIAPLTDQGFIRRYRNDGNGIFVGEDILGSLTVEHGEVQWGDYDGDGDLDILVAGNIKEIDSTYTHMALRIYRNDNETYTPVDISIAGQGWFDITAATWADYDSDGDIDILVAGTHNPGSQIEGRAKIYTNENGIFSESDNVLPAPRASGDRGGTFSWFDLDGDGDLDYFIAGQYFVPGGNGLIEAQMHVYRNDAAGQNNAPTTPTGLEAIIQSDNTVLLSWNPSTDDHTPSAALTYDIIVIRKGRHTPSDSINTRLPEPGNISAVNEWSFTGLPDGVYEWRLSAVDAAYAGSEIASSEFNIGVTSAGNSEQIPNSYSLVQNYPNPFNPSTTIKYTIPVEGFVNLVIYNLLGEKLTILVNQVQQAGAYEVNFDASHLTSGVYFYKIEAGSFNHVKKMIIIK